MIGRWALVSSFFNVLYYARVDWEGDDSLCWMPSRRSFEVKTLFKVLLPKEVDFLYMDNFLLKNSYFG